MSEQPWWAFPFGFPSNFTQPILPDWSLQRVEVNYAGNPAIEKEVVAKVASYGKQLGILSEAVLALAGDATGDRAARLDRLRAMAAEVEKIKQEHKRDLTDAARRALESLAKADPGAAERIASPYAKASRKTSS